MMRHYETIHGRGLVGRETEAAGIFYQADRIKHGNLFVNSRKPP